MDGISYGVIFNDFWVNLMGFEGHGIFDVEYLKNSASYGQSYYSTLIGNHT